MFLPESADSRCERLETPAIRRDEKPDLNGAKWQPRPHGSSVTGSRLPPMGEDPVVILETLILANVAGINPETGLLDVQGIGWRYYEPTAYPATITGNICGTVLVEAGDYGSIHELELEVGGDDGQVGRAVGALTFDCTEPSELMTVGRLVFHWPFTTVVRAPTVVTASIAKGGEQLGAIEFIARAPSAQA